MKPYAESCDQNRDPIIQVLKHVFSHTKSVLEIGSGTGQHAVYFARHLPHLKWQTSDVIENHTGIQLWLDDEKTVNVLPPLKLNVSQDIWPDEQYDGVFSANTAHIMAWPMVQDMFYGIAKILEPGGKFCLYGPFNYGGTYTSESNTRFDVWLKNRDINSGIRDFEALEELATRGNLSIEKDYAMPANNRILVDLI